MGEETKRQLGSRGRVNLLQFSLEEATRTAKLLHTLLELAQGDEVLAPAELHRGLAIETAGERRRLRVIAREMYLRRLTRSRFVKGDMFGEPAWDMLLALYAAELTGVRYTVTQVSSYAGTPATTSLRWIDYLETHGYVVRTPSVNDRRCYNLELSDDARKDLDAYFQEVGGKLDREGQRECNTSGLEDADTQQE